MCVFNVSPQAKVIWGWGPLLKVSSNRLVKPVIEPSTPDLQGKWFIHYYTAQQLLFITQLSHDMTLTIIITETYFIFYSVDLAVFVFIVP